MTACWTRSLAIGAWALAVLAASGSVAWGATIGAPAAGSPGYSPYSGDIQVRGDMTFTVGGALTCSGNGSTTYGVVANGTLTSSIVGESFSPIGSFSTTGSKPSNGIYFGSNLLPGATMPTACASTWTGITSCTVAKVTSAPFAFRVDSARPGDSGVYFRTGPIVFSMTCSASGGGTFSCNYTTGAATPGTGSTGPGVVPIESDRSLYSGSPARVSTLTYSDKRGYTAPNPFVPQQTFFRSSGGSGGAFCPTTGAAGTPAVAGTVRATLRLYSRPASGTPVQLFIWKSNP